MEKGHTLNRVLWPEPYRRIFIRFPRGARGFLYDTWTGASPWAVTHVNRDNVIVFPYCDAAVTHYTPARPDMRLDLNRNDKIRIHK